MPIGLVVVIPMVIVGALWTSVLLLAHFVRCVRQRRRIREITERVEELLAVEQSSGRHHLRDPRHA